MDETKTCGEKKTKRREPRNVFGVFLNEWRRNKNKETTKEKIFLGFWQIKEATKELENNMKI